MGLTDLFLAQITDPFRIGIAAALVLTMLRTRAATGVWRPLLAGVVFIAVLIPLTTGAGQGNLASAIGVGVLSTAVLAGILTGLVTLVLRAMGR